MNCENTWLETEKSHISTIQNLDKRIKETEVPSLTYILIILMNS